MSIDIEGSMSTGTHTKHVYVCRNMGSTNLIIIEDIAIE